MKDHDKTAVEKPGIQENQEHAAVGKEPLGDNTSPAVSDQTMEFSTADQAGLQTDVDKTRRDGETAIHTPLPGSGTGVHSSADERTLASVDARDSKRRKQPAPSATASMIGREIGDYLVDAELGRGGMGVVYRAHHRKLRRDVAIKMVLGAALADRLALERFAVEARSVARLQHPNVAQLYEFGSVDDSPFFALEYVDGGTLADRFKENALEPLRATQIVEQLARAMAVAHELGILHRDLKPANILMTSDGIPKITDFGLAKELVGENQEETKTGTVMGTPSFMSPEQAMGQISELSGATDQYSLGAILYACISGRPPFMSSSMIDTIAQVVHKEPVPPRQLSSTIPKDLETICLKTLQKDPSKRYRDCGELADDLQRFIRGEPISARPVSKVERAWRWCKRNPTIAVPSSLAGLFIIATAAISSWAWAATSAQAAVISEQRDVVAKERDEAQRQRDEARRQKIIADQQKAVAEDNERIAEKQAQLALKNIQFVVTDVDKLLREQAAMSQVRIGILEAVSDNWDELNVEMAGGIRGEAIPTLMAVRQLIAIAFRDLDRLQQAYDEFHKLEEMARERIALKGRNDATRSNLAKVLLASAPLARRLDNPQIGIERLEESVELVREILRDPQEQEGSPSQNEIQQLLAAATQNLGVEYLREGRIADTEQAFTESLNANTQVLDSIRGEPGFDQLNDNQKDTKTAALQIALDKSRLGLAYIRLRLGKTEESLPLYQSAISSRREIFERRPQMLIMKSELAGHLKLYGKSLFWLDRLDEAEPVLREAVSLADEAWQSDPEKVDLKRGLSESLYLFGKLRDLQGLEDESISLLERSRLLRSQLATASPDEKNQINLMLSEASLGNSDAARALIDDLGEESEPNGELHLERARAPASLAAHAQGDRREELVSEALDALQRSVEDGFSDPFRVRVETELMPLRNSDRFVGVVGQLTAARQAEPAQ